MGLIFPKPSGRYFRASTVKNRLRNTFLWWFIIYFLYFTGFHFCCCFFLIFFLLVSQGALQGVFIFQTTNSTRTRFFLLFELCLKCFIMMDRGASLNIHNNKKRNFQKKERGGLQKIVFGLQDATTAKYQMIKTHTKKTNKNIDRFSIIWSSCTWIKGKIWGHERREKKVVKWGKSIASICKSLFVLEASQRCRWAGGDWYGVCFNNQQIRGF